MMINQNQITIRAKSLNKEYTTIDGDAAFTKLTADLAFGEGNSITAEGRNATFQVKGVSIRELPFYDLH